MCFVECYEVVLTDVLLLYLRVNNWILESGFCLMTVEHHAYHFQAYPLLAFVPVGKKNKRIRTIGQKVQKGMIHRVHEQVKRKVAELTPAEIKKLQLFLQKENEAVLPIPLNKEDELYSQLIKPEMFLWQSFSPMHGLPIHQEFLYNERYLTLSSEGLDNHFDEVIGDYLFCANLAEKSREQWENQIILAFQHHPFIQLARKNKEVVEAVEKMNHSPLISLLNYPEDLSFWRHRVGIVMRPYRSIPNEWLWNEDGVCTHEKNMVLYSSKRQIGYFCEKCRYGIFYNVGEDRVVLQEEVDMERARKRIATIERQFNEMVAQTPLLLEKIEDVSRISAEFKPYEPLFEEVLVQQATVSKDELSSLETPFIIKTYFQLKGVRLPEERTGSPLLWLSNIFTETIEPFKPRTPFPKLNEEVLKRVQIYLEEMKSFLQASTSDRDEYLVVKYHTMTYGDIKSVLRFVAADENSPLHLLTKVFTGKATNALRAQRLHENTAFGLLEDMEEKHVVKVIKRLEKEHLLQKLTKGYGLTEKGRQLAGIENESQN